MKLLPVSLFLLLSTNSAWATPKKASLITQSQVTVTQSEEKYTIKGLISIYSDGDRAANISRVSTTANGTYIPLPFSQGKQCVVIGQAMGDLNNLSISVRNGKGELIATGAIEKGYFRLDDTLFFCDIPFTISSLPKSDFYTIKLGSRGTFDYSFEQMEKLNWRLNLTF